MAKSCCDVLSAESVSQPPPLWYKGSQRAFCPKKENLMNPNIVKQYRAHLQLTHPKPRTCELISDDLDTVKEDVNRILGGNGVKFVEAPQSTAGGGGLTLIFHPSFNAGKTSLGWISPYEVPESMSVGATIDQRLQAAA
jgi:hypothetical protein